GKGDLVWTFTINDKFVQIVYLATPAGGDFDVVSTQLDDQIFPNQALYSEQRAHLADVNADGKADLLWTYNYTNDLGRVLYLSSVEGTSFVNVARELDTPSGVDPNNHVAPRVRLTDLNGDGNLDLAYNYHDPNQLQFGSIWYLADGDGQGFTESISVSEGTQVDYENFEYHYADVSGDGNADLVWTYNTGQHVLERVLFRQPQAYPDHIEEIVDGLGAATQLDYAYMADPSIYTKGTGSTYPVRDDGGLGYVVTELRTSDGIGGFYTKRYRYEGGRTDLSGRGYLGFEKRVVVDVPRGFTTTETYRQDFPFIGQLESAVLAHTASSQAIQKNYQHWQDGVLTHPSGRSSRFAYVRDSAEIRYDLTDGNEVAAKVEVHTYDEPSGNLTNQVQTMGLAFTGAIDGAFTRAGAFVSGDVGTPELTVTTVNDFTPDFTAANWRLGFLERQTMTYAAPGETTRTVVTEYAPSGPDRFTLAEGRQFVGSGVAARNTYTRDAFGNATSILTNGDDIDGGAILSRDELAGPFDEGLYPATRTNALGHVTNFTYDRRHGEIDRETDPNGLATDRVFDGFGRQIFERAFDGTETRFLYTDCSGSCPLLAAYSITTRVSHPNEAGKFASPPVRRFYDVFNREISSETPGFDGRSVVTLTSYDALGRVASESVPHYSGDPVPSYDFEYDAHDRETRRVGSDGHETTSVYSSDPTFAARVVVTESIITPAGLRTVAATRQFDALGKVVRILDANGTPTELSYDTQGNLRAVRVNNAPASDITIETDVAGNKTRIVDPDAGEIVMAYDAMANLRRQTHAPVGDTATVTTTYDRLSRMLTRDEVDASTTSTSTWAYDLNGKLGTLSSALRTNVQFKSFGYDHYTRLNLTGEVSIHLLEAQEFAYDYDAFSRRKKKTYPSSFAVETKYNALGYRLAIDDSKTKGNLWTAVEYDAKGNVTRERFGNGLETTHVYSPLKSFAQSITTGTPSAPNVVQDLDYGFDTLGNVYSRTSARAGVELYQEQFLYDDLHRLTQASTTGLAGGPRQIDYGYDALGNIRTKSDVSDVDGYVYGGNGGGVHAVSSVTQGGTTTQYQYDTRGNMTSAGDRTIQYTPFNKPSSITRPGVTLDFLYGPDQKRVYQQLDRGGQVTETLYYNGGEYERVIENNQIRSKSYVAGFLVHTTVGSTNGPGAGGDLAYLHRDHNGSTEAVTDRDGNLAERYVFAPFGSRRQGDWENADAAFAAGLPASTFKYTTQGFTGHEHLDSVGIIHMNGRIYEPSLGRFMSPDTFVQFPEISQSYNRYSYVLNNPLSYRDPSGEVIPVIIVVAWKAYDIYDTVTSGVEDFQTVTDSNASSSDRALAAVSLASNAVGVPKPVRKIGGAIFDMVAKRTPKSVKDAVKKQVDRVFSGKDAPTSRPDTPSTRQVSDNAGQPKGGRSNKPDGEEAPAQTQRLQRDADVNPEPPEALPTSRPISKSPTQNARKDEIVRKMEDDGFTDIRVDQQQVNAAGERVGINRPDIQGTSPDGRRVNVELDRSTSNRGPGHRDRILANDPDADVILEEVD
ncbi:MAG: FG-GAP-like repeat-containing protein, partial [Proteobacteria bacterium]|nr:FG-GAP-like repeat-containing protein [Pseudomonadota bacterium]